MYLYYINQGVSVIRPHPPTRPRPSLSSKELSYSSPAMKGRQEVVELLVVPSPLPSHLCISHHEELSENIHLYIEVGRD